jgi:hypothetical protein
MAYTLLSVGKDAKTVKGEKFGYLTGILYMQPASLSGVNLCRGSSAGCREACLFSAGMAKFPAVKKGRARKTAMFLNQPEEFMKALKADVALLEKQAKKKGMGAVVRLNGTTDIPWEEHTIDGLTIFEHFPNVNFMDYTKILKRMLKGSAALAHPNYHLTFSRSEANERHARLVMSIGGNVAVVFAGKTLPKTFLRKRVVNGDESDLRFLDKKGVVVGLYAKGKAKKDTSGFVVINAR